ncbi:MAG: MBL fold metallo-hydrolase [Eubacteriales bacterium]|nr:MBL fold metallo-hydrolase [Eubacteriales bacterium]
MNVKQIKIDFHVTPEIKRYVYVYLIETEDGCALVDSGVAGSEEIIEKAMLENGHQPSEIKAVFLTHAHPDHIGTANYFREKYGAEIYASEGERAWIEDIDLQFAERPIPNFYHLAGQSTRVDHVVKDGDKVYLTDGTCIEVIGTPGHSADEVSYRIEDVVFIGDTVPVRGDIPIFIHLENTLHSLEILENLSGVETFYPAWDQEYSFEMMREKIADAREIIQKLEQNVRAVGTEVELSALVSQVCDRLHTPMWKENPLFARAIDCCRGRK